MQRNPNRTAPAARIFLNFWWVYLILFGGWGVYEPFSGLITLVITGGLGVGWLVWRTRSRWKWHIIPIDRLLPLWVGAFLLSWAANADLWRQISLGVWFGLAYLAVWVILHDLLANHAITRNDLIMTLLLGGGVIILYSLPEAVNLIRIGLSDRNLPFERLTGQMGGPVLTASAFAVCIPAAVGALVAARRRIVRLIWGLYVVAGLGLLFMTQSRGGWIATFAGIMAFGALRWAGGAEADRGIRGWWRGLPNAVRAFVVAFAALVVVMGGWVLISRTASIANQSTIDARPALFQTALTMFSERPITGYGLFSYGTHYMRLGSLPPDEIHNQAHNIFLNIAGELGLVGVVLGALSVLIWVAAMRVNFTALQGQSRTLLAGAMAACVGFLVHHQFDVSAIVIVGALLGLFPLAAATTPISPLPAPRWLQGPRTGLIAGLCGLLLTTGIWDRQTSAEYLRLLVGPLSEKSATPYAEQAVLLDPVIAADPAMPAYVLTQAGLYAAVADGGDLEAARQGVAAYERFCSLNPYYGPAWANLAVLRWQLGDQAAAIEAMRRAAEGSPRFWALWANLGALQEQAGDQAGARASYTRALRDYPGGDLTLYPFWEATPLRREVIAPRRAEGYTNWGQAVQTLRAGDPAEARRQFDSKPHIPNPIYDAIEMALSYTEGRREEMRQAWGRITYLGDSNFNIDARLFGQAVIALDEGNREAARAALTRLRQSTARRPLFLLTRMGANNLNIIHYFRIPTLQDQFVPGVYNPNHSPLLHPLMDWLEAQLQ